MLAAAILFSVFSISAFAEDEYDHYNQRHYIAFFNNDIFDCCSTMYIQGGTLTVILDVALYDKYNDPFDPLNPLYPDYEPTGVSYSISLSIMTVFKIYNEQMTTAWTYDGGTLSGVQVVEADNSYLLDVNVPYQYVSTENYITITDLSNNSSYEVFLNSIGPFWT